MPQFPNFPTYQPPIFDIKRFSLHDGPGIRTTVFLKGCPLSCAWCHNPESQKSTPELIFRAERCLGCGACVDACPEEAITMAEGRSVTAWARCTHCGECAQVCYPGAREMACQEMTVEEVLEIVERDRPFYEESGGGVTFSGGEPLAHPDFLEAALVACREAGLHTALDTSGHAPWEVIDRIRPHVDLFLYDVKLLDDAQHQNDTGVSNRLLLANLQKLAELGHNIHVRTPLVPGINVTPAQIQALGKFVAQLPGVSRLDVLPYHEMAAEKYRRLGRDYPLHGLQSPDEETVQKTARTLREFGLEVHVGG
ncbi:MAG: Choline trimethylamine-lyase activating enzyme [Chloroflexi bacterium]|nr:Choline trimethylamine-lyase activating enzyme [Chloroflexota bacterium]